MDRLRFGSLARLAVKLGRFVDAARCAHDARRCWWKLNAADQTDETKNAETDAFSARCSDVAQHLKEFTDSFLARGKPTVACQGSSLTFGCSVPPLETPNNR